MSQAQRNLPAQQRGKAPAKIDKQQEFARLVTGELMRKKVNEVIGGKDGQRFITSIISAVSTNPALAECDHGTILSAAMVGESLKLSPSPQLGQYYMVPFKDKRRCKFPSQKNPRFCKTCHDCEVAQFQIGYKGYIQLALRTGQYRKLNVLSIKEGELIRYDPLFEEIEVDLIQDDSIREQTRTIGYYAMFEYLNGFRKTMYWSYEKMLSHADRFSQAFKAADYKRLLAGEIPESEQWKFSSFWYKDFDGMAYKTMLRQIVSKWGIMSIEMQTAMESDMGAVHEIGGPVSYVENQPLSFTNEQLPSSENEIVDTSALLALMPAGTDETKLREFLAVSAKVGGVNMSEVVDGAIEQIDGFKGHYANWLAKNHPQTTEEPSPQAAVRAELADRRAQIEHDIKEYDLDRTVIEKACNAFVADMKRNQIEKAEGMIQDMIAEAEKQMAAEDGPALPEKVTCPNSKTVVRPAVECADCPKNNGCPALI
jgi:recombination protein RecT